MRRVAVLGARLRGWLGPRWPAVVAATFGLYVFVSMGGDRAIDPTDTRWITAGTDWGYHWVGWLYFRAAPWGWPLGDTPNLFHPVGTTVGFMDGIPWLALVEKLASPLLPDRWQHIGPWLAACFMLQGWFGARLAARLTPSPQAQAFAGALLALTPALAHRVQHEALCAHFLLLAALALYVRPREERARYAHVALPAIAIGVHPYLAAMVVGIVLASLASDAWRGAMPWRHALARAVGALAVVAALAWAFGYLAPGGAALRAKGFGQANADLLTLVNPQRTSRFLHDHRILPEQREGFAYLGLGVIALLVSGVGVAAHAAIRRAPALPWRRAVPLAVVAALATLFALGGVLTADGHVQADLSSWYAWLGDLRGTFRASGRFVWVLVYALDVVAIALWARRQPRLVPYALAACFAVQLADWRELHLDRFRNPHAPPEHAPAWALARGAYDHLAVYPPRCGDPNGPCCNYGSGARPEDMYLAELAVELGLTYNGFGAARVDRARLKPWCAAFQASIRAGELDPRTIYVVWHRFEEQFRAANPTAPCRHLDDELVCVAPAAAGPFRDALAQPE